MLSLLLVVSIAAAETNPVLAIPITRDFVTDSVIRGYFADLVRQGVYGHSNVERAAFIVRNPEGTFRCLPWPLHRDFREQYFRGKIPEGTVAVAHTHPGRLPMPSAGDQDTARRFSLPIIVLTPMNIYLVTSDGKNVPLVENEHWIDVNDASSSRCTAPTLHASHQP